MGLLSRVKRTRRRELFHSAGRHSVISVSGTHYDSLGGELRPRCWNEWEIRLREQDDEAGIRRRGRVADAFHCHPAVPVEIDLLENCIRLYRFLPLSRGSLARQVET